MQSDRDILRRLLSAAGSKKPAGRTDVEAADYDWNAPCRFVPAQLERLEGFAKAAARKVSEALGDLLRTELEFASGGVTQHFAGRLRGQTPEAKEYWAELQQDGRPCGLIALPAERAAAWVGRLLGGTGPGAAGDRELSALESAILLNVLAAIIGAFSQSAQDHGGGAFTRSESVSSGEYALPGADAEEYCRIALAPAGEEAGPGLSLLVIGDALEPLAGCESATQAKSPDEICADMLAHLAKVPVPTEVWLGKAQVPMREVMALEPGDVLVIQKGIGEPVDLLVQGQRVCSGFPVISEGRYALQIAFPAGAARR